QLARRPLSHCEMRPRNHTAGFRAAVPEPGIATQSRNNNGWPRSAITGLMQRNKSGAYRWSKESLHGRYLGINRTLRRLLEYDGSKPVRSYFKDILLFSANY